MARFNKPHAIAEPLRAEDIDDNFDAVFAMLRRAQGAFSSTGLLPVPGGGTGAGSWQTGDILYASSPTTLAGLHDVALGNVVLSGGVGAPPSYGKVALSGATTHITGTLPIASGGTGQTAQAPAFDALAPTTTKGDLIVHDGTDNIRVAVGTDGFILSANSATGSGVEWVAAGSGSGDVVGPASAVDGEIVVFDGVTGKLVKAATGTGVVHATAGVFSVAPVDLTTEVTGNLPYANFEPATAVSLLLGRGAAGGAGDWEEITLGSGLAMTGTVLSATGGGSSPLTTKGDLYSHDGSTDIRFPVGSDGQILSANSATTSGLEWIAPGSGSGDVVGPASSVDSEIALFDGTTGKLIKALTALGSSILSSDGSGVPTWISVIPVANGGTGSFTFGGINTLLYTTAVDVLASIPAAANSVLISDASGAPLWSAGPLPVNYGGTGFAAFAVGNMLYANTTSTFAAIPTVAGSVLITDSFGVPHWSTVLSTFTGLTLASGQILLPDGSSIAPSLSFADETNTGIYSGGFGRIDISVLGNPLVTFENTLITVNVPVLYQGGWTLGTGQALVPDGSAAAPPYSFSSDSNTGIYLAAADVLGFSTGGVARVTIESNGQILASSVAGAPTYAFDATTGLGIDSGVLELRVAGVEVMRFTGLAVEVDSQVYPLTDNTYDFGLGISRWKDGYFGGNLSGGILHAIGPLQLVEATVAAQHGFHLGVSDVDNSPRIVIANTDTTPDNVWEMDAEFGGGVSQAFRWFKPGALYASLNSSGTGGGFKLHLTTAGYTERNRTVAMGEWIQVAFNAANFTALGGGTWVATAQSAYRYTLSGKTMTMTVGTDNSTVAGTVNPIVVAVPGGFVCAVTGVIAGSAWLNGGGIAEMGMVYTAGSTLQLYRPAIALYPAGNYRVGFTAKFEIL